MIDGVQGAAGDHIERVGRLAGKHHVLATREKEGKMRRTWIALVSAFFVLLAAQAAAASVTKFTFNDVTLPDGQVGEIEASVKILKNKPDSVTCSYFTDDYQESLGYYFDFHEPAPTESDAVVQICLDGYDERHV